MTDADRLRGFVTSLLKDAGSQVRDDGVFVWAQIPEALQVSLDLPPQVCLTFDPDRTGEFDAELVAPGSYFLEKLLALAMRRGRSDMVRMAAPPAGWAEDALAQAGMPPGGVPPTAVSEREEPLFLLAFRTTLVSDEKREAFRLIAVDRAGSEAWSVDGLLPEEGLAPADLAGFAPDMERIYERACGFLAASSRDEVAAFRKSALTSLEEEVRRIFQYFDGTVREVREAAPSGAEDVVRAIEAERDRRLAEALERFEPHASASLCSLRVVLAPEARAHVPTADGEREIRVDALTRHARGLPRPTTGDAPAPPRARPRSDTPRRRTRGGPGRPRSPRGSTGRSRFAASRRPGA